MREVLELLGVPYVGAGPARLPRRVRQADRQDGGRRAAGHRARRPRSRCRTTTFRELGAAAGAWTPMVARLGLPLVVKPAEGGSALGCTLVARRRAELPDAMVDCLRLRRPVALVERLRRRDRGRRDRGRRRRRARARCRRSRSGRTAASTTTRRATPPARPSSSVPARAVRRGRAAECARVAVAAHEALGLRDLSRSDLIVDADGTVWFLEVNVAPGMTETSTGAAVGRGRRAGPRRGAGHAGPGGLGPRRTDDDGPAVRDLTYPPIIVTAKTGFRRARAALPDHRHRARPARGRRAARAQPHRLRRLRLRRLGRQPVGPPGAVHGQARAVRPPVDRPADARRCTTSRSTAADGEASLRDARSTTCARGEAVGIFPEATISRAMELKEFKTGAVRIAAEAGVPLVPVILWGTQRMMTKDHPRDFSRGKTITITRRRAAAPDRRGPRRRDRRAARGDDRRCSTRRSAPTPPPSSRPAPGGCPRRTAAARRRWRRRRGWTPTEKADRAARRAAKDQHKSI